MSFAIETIGLTRNFGELVAVDHLDLCVERGTLFGFLGPNGAGKSTTIKMLIGLLQKSAGSASLMGHDIDRDAVEAKRSIGVVPEELALFERLTGPEYLTFVGRMYGLGREVIHPRRDELLELMGLHEAPRKLIVDYSHGMKKKLALAAALIHQPGLLFLDEPFEGIDAIASRSIKELLRSLLERGVTVFLTSHILEIVEKLCDEIGIIDHGRLIARGSLTDLRRGVTLRDEHGEERERTLEEIFLDLVAGDETHAPALSWLG